MILINHFKLALENFYEMAEATHRHSVRAKGENTNVNATAMLQRVLICTFAEQSYRLY